MEGETEDWEGFLFLTPLIPAPVSKAVIHSGPTDSIAANSCCAGTRGQEQFNNEELQGIWRTGEKEAGTGM